MAIFTSYTLDFLAQIFGCSAYHQPCNEHGEDDENENAVEPPHRHRQIRLRQA